jgi:hypothetical protein
LPAPPPLAPLPATHDFDPPPRHAGEDTANSEVIHFFDGYWQRNLGSEDKLTIYRCIALVAAASGCRK